MSEKFDYYYGEESESCSFYRIPRLLVLGTRFSGLSTDAKLLDASGGSYIIGQGRLLVVHCAAGAGGVTLSCSNGFTQAARPGWYGEE